MFRRLIAALSAVALVCMFAQSAMAQGKGNAPKGTAVTVKGKVKQVVPQGILVDGDDNKTYALGFNNASKVTMAGTAGADYLGPGMFVQMDVDLDAQGKPTKDVTKVQITEPSSLNTPGVFSTAGPDGKPGEAGVYLVRGTVRANKAGALTVAAGNKTVNVQLSAAVSIPVTTSNWRMAQPGDSVDGQAQAFNQPGAPFTPALAERVEIKAVMPFQKKGR